MSPEFFGNRFANGSCCSIEDVELVPDDRGVDSSLSNERLLMMMISSWSSSSSSAGNDSTHNRSATFDDDDDLLNLLKNIDNDKKSMSTPAAMSYLIDRYVAPVIVVLGLIGNVVSLAVFSERTMLRRSSSVYLAALSAVDVAFLTCVLLSWTAQTRFDLYGVDGLCQLFTYVTYVSSFLGVWYVVGFTVERYIAVHYPLRRQSLCTAAKARRSVSALAVFAGLAYSFGAWTSGVTVIPSPLPGADADYRVCVPLGRYAMALSVVHTIDTVVTLLLPFVAITVLNLRIAVTVVRCNRARRAMSRPSVRRLIVSDADARSRCRTCGPSTLAFPSSPQPQQHQHQQHVRRSTSSIARFHSQFHVSGSGGGGDQFRVTKLLLTVSAAFLVLNLPRHAARTYSLFIDLTHPYSPPSPVFLVYQKLFQIIYYLQFAVNIILYATIGRSNFRGALRRIAHRTKRRLSNASMCIRLSFASVWWRSTCRACVCTSKPEMNDIVNCRRRSCPMLPSSSHQMAVLSSSLVTLNPQQMTGTLQRDASSHVSLD